MLRLSSETNAVYFYTGEGGSDGDCAPKNRTMCAPAYCFQLPDPRKEGKKRKKGGKGSRRALLIRQARWNTGEENPGRSQRQAGISKG